MKILHIADLHLGQILYQSYDRVDEHEYFFTQLEDLCTKEKPDALLLSGDVFDIQQPSASTKKSFTDHFVHLHECCPAIKLVITAGNHDSASRIQADRSVWNLANACLVGTAPSPDFLTQPDGWQQDYIVELPNGFIIALPYMSGERTALIQSILDYVAGKNTDGKPVVMMAHLAVTGMDATGHSIDIGTIKTQNVSALGTGYDYVALGHIHKPQTIGHQEDCMKDDVEYPSGVVRYSGSTLHVSCDENYPHTISIVDIKKHEGAVHIRQHRIEQLRHFYVLPLDGSSFTSADDAIEAIQSFADTYRKGYFRLRFDYNTALQANFTNEVYDIIRIYDNEIRFNPKHIWTGVPNGQDVETEKPTFEVAELQQMTDPMTFIERTKDHYPGLDLEVVRECFTEVEKELARMAEEEKASSKKGRSKATNGNAETQTPNA